MSNPAQRFDRSFVLHNAAATATISAAALLCFTVFLLIRKSKKELDRESPKRTHFVQPQTGKTVLNCIEKEEEEE